MNLTKEQQEINSLILKYILSFRNKNSIDTVNEMNFIQDFEISYCEFKTTSLIRSLEDILPELTRKGGNNLSGRIYTFHTEALEELTRRIGKKIHQRIELKEYGIFNLRGFPLEYADEFRNIIRLKLKGGI